MSVSTASLVFNHPSSFVLGYWTEFKNPKACNDRTDITLGKSYKHNLPCALCLIPLIGSVIAGVLRLAFSIHSLKRLGNSEGKAGDQTILTAEIGRGAVELFGVGFLFAIADIIFTIGRRFANGITFSETQ